MSETIIGWLAAGNIGLLSLACGLYQWGGRSGGPGKGVRRFGASFIIFSAINATAGILGLWVPLLLAVYPMAIFTFIQGYGGNSLPKIIQRILIVITSLGCGALCAWIFGCWWLMIIHGIVASASVFFAIKNPIQAAAEEVMVCFLLYGICLFYPFSI